jgi:hypothetical protein
MIERDENGVLHVVGLSGGDDSTLLSFLLKEREPRPYNYLCTPTGNELPEMFAHWRWLASDNALGQPIIPIMAGTLKGVIEQEKMLPTFAPGSARAALRSSRMRLGWSSKRRRGRLSATLASAPMKKSAKAGFTVISTA